jgi:ABC-type sugar transport system ATPase subunit
VADRIAILDRGQIVGEFRGDAVTTVQLMEYMQNVARTGGTAGQM